MDNKRSVRYLLIGTYSFFSLLALCIIIRPEGLIVNSGISYYGNHIETLLPYVSAFLVNSYLLWLAASAIGDNTKTDKYFKFVLKMVAVLMLGILVTPHNIFNAPGFNLIHRTIGTFLFSSQIVMAVAIVLFVYRDWLNIFLLMTSFVSGYAALIYILQPTGFMIEAQIVFQISIWSLYIRYLEYADARVERLHANNL